MKWTLITRCGCGPPLLAANHFLASGYELAHGLCHVGYLLEEPEGNNRTVSEAVHKEKKEKGR